MGGGGAKKDESSEEDEEEEGERGEYMRGFSGETGPTRTHRIRTTPAVPRKGRRPESSGHFDVALVVVDRIKYREGKGFDGGFFLYKFYTMVH